MNYVMHVCRNSRNVANDNGKKRTNPDYCNNGWIDKDLTGAETYPPSWKYCRECCEKLGIDFDKQRPSDYRTEAQNEKYRKQVIELQKSRVN